MGDSSSYSSCAKRVFACISKFGVQHFNASFTNKLGLLKSCFRIQLNSGQGYNPSLGAKLESFL